MRSPDRRRKNVLTMPVPDSRPHLSPSSWCSACWCSCTSLATTSPPAGCACMSRSSRSASAGHRFLDGPVGTDWKLAWLPLGGYVKLHGQERRRTSPRGPGELDSRRDLPRESRFGRAHRRGCRADRQLPAGNGAVRAAVCHGRSPGEQPVVGDVLAGSAAARAGIQADDRIVAIDGSPTSSFEEIQRIVAAHPAETLSVKILRGQNTMSFLC